MSPEIVVGRWLAFCAHPTAAWRILPPSGRCLLAASYAAASFMVSLTVLLAL
jgi:hypothetical protein